VELIPIKGEKKDGGLSASITLQKFRIVDRYSLPEKVLSDGSSSFQAEFDEYLNAHNVIYEQGLAYKHDTNGMVERMIWTIEEKLRHYIRTGLRDWGNHHSQLQAGLNSHKAWGPKQSLFFLNRGKERRVELHGDVLGELDHLPKAEPEQQDHGLW
jgi:hypothetical protein